MRLKDKGGGGGGGRGGEEIDEGGRKIGQNTSGKVFLKKTFYFSQADELKDQLLAKGGLSASRLVEFTCGEYKTNNISANPHCVCIQYGMMSTNTTRGCPGWGGGGGGVRARAIRAGTFRDTPLTFLDNM